MWFISFASVSISTVDLLVICHDLFAHKRSVSSIYLVLHLSRLRFGNSERGIMASVKNCSLWGRRPIYLVLKLFLAYVGARQVSSYWPSQVARVVYPMAVEENLILGLHCIPTLLIPHPQILSLLKGPFPLQRIRTVQLSMANESFRINAFYS